MMQRRRAKGSTMAVMLVSGLMLPGLFAQPQAYPPPVQRAIARLARVMGVAAEQIQVVSYEAVQWPDASLGAPRPGRMYAQVITPGYKVLLTHQDRLYEYHTDLHSRVVLAEVRAIAGVGAAKSSAAGFPPESAAAIERCRDDLARRLKAPLEQIHVDKVEPAVFPDGSLGFPRPGEAYTKAITRGWRIVLRRNDRPYLYAANETSIRYGGPADARRVSALYLQRIENEPNLNGRLMQIALAGDNARPVLTGVSDFRPQADGSVLAMRRTSRSGFDLLYLPPQKAEAEAVKLMSAFSFADAVVTPDGQRWAALVRSWVGDPWRLVSGSLPHGPEGEGQTLPEGLAERLYLEDPEHPIVSVLERPQLQRAYFRWEDNAWKRISFTPPEEMAMILSKSESLHVHVKQEGEKPVTEIVRTHWREGDRLLARLEDFQALEWALTPGAPFLLLSGRTGTEDLQRGYSVDIMTGEIFLTIAAADSPVRPWAVPSAAPIVIGSD